MSDIINRLLSAIHKISPTATNISKCYSRMDRIQSKYEEIPGGVPRNKRMEYLSARIDKLLELYTYHVFCPCIGCGCKITQRSSKFDAYYYICDKCKKKKF